MTLVQPVVGVLPVLATPFTANWDLDEPVLGQELNWVYSQGADGVVVAMVSEISRLSIDEREQLAELVSAHNANRGPVVLSVGAESTPLAIRLARHAEAVGAAAVMANGPLVTRADDREVLDYYEQILDSVDVPLIVQDASGYVGGALSLDTQVLLHRRHGPHRVMFKPEAPPLGQRLTQLLDATDGEARVLEGSGGLALIDAYRRGLIGTMPGPDLVWAVAAIWAALRENDDERAYQIGGALIPLLCPLTSLDSYVVTQKHLLLKQGVFTDARVRGPNSYRIDRHTSEEIDRQYTLLRSTVDSPVSQFAAVRSPI